MLRCGKAEPRPRPGGPGRPGEDLGLLAEPLPVPRIHAGEGCRPCLDGLKRSLLWLPRTSWLT